MATLAQSTPTQVPDYLASKRKGFDEARIVWSVMVDPGQLHRLTRGWIRHLRRSLKATSLKEEATEVLRVQSSTLDQCEWAERYLCGMTRVDASSFSEHRPSQS